MKVINGKLRFVKRKNKGPDSDQDSEAESSQLQLNKMAESESLKKALSIEADILSNKQMMSPFDLMHLLEDSIEKTKQGDRKDHEIYDRCKKTQLFIKKSDKLFNQETSHSTLPENQKFRKDELN